MTHSADRELMGAATDLADYLTEDGISVEKIAAAFILQRESVLVEKITRESLLERTIDRLRAEREETKKAHLLEIDEAREGSFQLFTKYADALSKVREQQQEIGELRAQVGEEREAGDV